MKLKTKFVLIFQNAIFFNLLQSFNFLKSKIADCNKDSILTLSNIYKKNLIIFVFVLIIYITNLKYEQIICQYESSRISFYIRRYIIIERNWDVNKLNVQEMRT